MAKLFNLARMTVSGTPGTGDITLLAAVPPFLTFAQAGISNGDVVSYSIIDIAGCELGTATYVSATPALTGRTVRRSSGAANTGLISVTSAAHVLLTPGKEDFDNFPTLLNSGTVTNAATLDIVLTAYTAYRELLFILGGPFLPTTDAQDLWVRFSTNGGSTYDSGATDYHQAAFNMTDTAASVTVSNSSGDTKIRIGFSVGSTTTFGWVGEVRLFNPGIADGTKMSFQGTQIDDSSRARLTAGSGERFAAQDTDAVRFLFASGNIASGKWALYGYL